MDNKTSKAAVRAAQKVLYDMYYQRDKAILARWRAGETMEAIAKDYGFTRQRVSQIVKSLKVPR
jgi:predicted transcriptional regulator